MSDTPSIPMRSAEALAESWASIDGKLREFHACRWDKALDDIEGTYSGYVAEAQEMISRLEVRGYTLSKRIPIEGKVT